MTQAFTAFLDGLMSYFTDGTALGALVTFLAANLPSLAVTVTTVKRWLVGTRHALGVVEADCKTLAAAYTKDVAKLTAELAAQRDTTNRVLAMLSVAFANSKLSPAVRAELARLVTGTDLPISADDMATTITETPQATEALPAELTDFATGEPILLTD